MTRWFLLAGATLFSTTGCYLGSTNAEAGGSTSTSAGAGGGSSSSGSGGGALDVSASGLPCDVATLIAHDCAGCHSSPPSGGAPEPMLTYADLTAPAKNDPSKTLGALSVARLADHTMPPKPAAAPDAALVSAFSAWVSAGMPRGSCTQAIDAGTPVKSPYDTPVQCTSNQTGSRREGPDMAPGEACIACHQGSGEAPQFSIAGTVYPTAHEPDNCVGGTTTGPATITITDSNGKVVALPVSAGGNFYYQGAIALPYKAKVTVGSAERDMSASQTSGDCNSCHTQTGAQNAPGRIMAP